MPGQVCLQPLTHWIKVLVSEEIINVAEQHFTKSWAAVHGLVALPFHLKAQEFYNKLGSPVVDRNRQFRYFILCSSSY
jgi:hypothetical protein